MTFAAALYGVARLPRMPPHASATRPGPRAVAEGAAFIRRSQPLAGALARPQRDGIRVARRLVPGHQRERFGGSPRTLGLFTAAIGLGGLVSAGLSGPLRHVTRHGRAMLAAVAVWGAAFAGFAVAPGLGLTLGLLAVAGAVDTITVVFRQSILHLQ